MFNKLFKLDENKTDFKTELLAGITTFLAMSYILGVNPGMLSATGMSLSGVFIATALASGIACILMGLIANYPVGLAPGMGLNALFTYTIVLGMGLSWQAALAAVLLSSIIFLIITIIGLREAILNAIPKDLKLAIGAGIGFFLAFLGLANAGIIISDPATIVALGSVSSAPVLLALIGVAITLVLYVRKIPAAVFLGLVITAILGIIMTALGYGAGAEAVMPAIPTEWISFNLDFSVFGGFAQGFTELFKNIPTLIIIIFSLLFVTFFDTTGTLIPLAKECGYEKEDGTTEGINRAFISDAIGGIVGAIFGSSTVTAYVESATGIGLGGRTGLTAIITGILFLLSVFIAPTILSLFTSSVTTAALVTVGILMFVQIRDIEWDNLAIVASVFMTIIMMVLSYSISLGIAFGFITYTIVAAATGKAKELNPLVWVLFIVFILYLVFGL
ncbi:MAG: NCS2 family permease [Methanobrevibacter sp.]|uniref:NCS2 family permease n=1 Tax=Methanobrevibacter sp. TaxID=66852 RepID=UPI0025EF2B2C|nr:NCS2 family permease [Methanobrevibacter sp.]MBE6498739.1 NCS2 family permease [Methanobrevibacter sp.]